MIIQFSIDNTITNPREIMVLGIQGLSNGNIIVMYSKKISETDFIYGNGIVKIVDSEFNIIKEFTPEYKVDRKNIFTSGYIKNETKIFEFENGNLAFYSTTTPIIMILNTDGDFIKNINLKKYNFNPKKISQLINNDIAILNYKTSGDGEICIYNSLNFDLIKSFTFRAYTCVDMVVLPNNNFAVLDNGNKIKKVLK